MSSKKSSRKRSQVNSSEEEGTSEKKPKTEKIKSEIPDLIPFKVKQPIVAPNGKVFYPCQYCSKIFPQKMTSITHMKKCPNKSHILTIGNKNETNVNNNDISQESIQDHTTNEEHKETQENSEENEVSSEENEVNSEKNEVNSEENEVSSEENEVNSEENEINSEENQVSSEDCSDLNSSSSSTENKPPEPKIQINQVVMLKSAQPEKQAMNDTSIYDYNEQDPEENELKENDDKAENSNSCKHCDAFFESPLDLLRHTRDIHTFPKTILPPDEIEKYFDSPNREFCPICKKKIKTNNFRSVFIKHLLVHTTGLTHECGICKKKFRRRDHMRVHEKRHIVSV